MQAQSWGQAKLRLRVRVQADGAGMICRAPVAKAYGPRSAVLLSGVPVLEGTRHGM